MVLQLTPHPAQWPQRPQQRHGSGGRQRRKVAEAVLERLHVAGQQTWLGAAEAGEKQHARQARLQLGRAKLRGESRWDGDNDSQRLCCSNQVRLVPGTLQGATHSS